MLKNILKKILGISEDEITSYKNFSALYDYEPKELDEVENNSLEEYEMCQWYIDHKDGKR